MLGAHRSIFLVGGMGKKPVLLEGWDVAASPGRLRHGAEDSTAGSAGNGGWKRDLMMRSKEGCCWPGSLRPSCCSPLLGQARGRAGPTCASPAWRRCRKTRGSVRSGTACGLAGAVLCSCAPLAAPSGVVSLRPATPPSHLPSARCRGTARPGCPQG